MADEPPVSPMSMDARSSRPTTAEPIDEDPPIPGLLGRLLSAVGLGPRRTETGDQAAAASPTSSSSDSEAPPAPAGMVTSPPRSTRSSRRALAKDADAAPPSTSTVADEDDRVLDHAMSGLHLTDPTAKPGAAFLPPAGTTTATPPLPPKPLATAVPPPATAPPALARPITRRAAAAAASGTSSAAGAGSSAGSEAEDGRKAGGGAGASAVEAEAVRPPPPTAEAKAAVPAPTQPPPAATKPPGKTRAAAATGPSTAASPAPPTPASSSAALIPHPRAAPTAHLSTPPTSPSPSDLAVGLVYDAAMEAHIPPTSHVERPARLSVLAALLAKRGLAGRCAALTPRPATDEELLRMHSPDHIAAVDGGYEAALADGGRLEQGDMYYSPGTARAARLAAGCVTQAVLAVLSGEVRRAFCVVRPPGHHAVCNRAMGFCFYNNTAVAAAAALKAGAERVLIVDWDVHHGNGVADLVDAANGAAVKEGGKGAARPALAYVSIHRGGGFYPGSGWPVETGPPGAKGTTLNVAWPRGGATDADYAAAFDLVVMPWAAAFGPDLIIIAAGMDAAAGDPLGGCDVSPAGFAHMARRLCGLGVGVVAALEGGYNTGATAAAGAAVVEALLQAGGGEDPEGHGGGGGGGGGGGAATPTAPPGRPSREAGAAIEAAVAAHAEFVPALRPLAGSAAFNRAWQDYCLATQAARVLRPRGGGTGGGSGSATPVPVVKG